METRRISAQTQNHFLGQRQDDCGLHARTARVPELYVHEPLHDDDDVQHRKVCKGFGKVPFPQVLVPFELSCFFNRSYCDVVSLTWPLGLWGVKSKLVNTGLEKSTASLIPLMGTRRNSSARLWFIKMSGITNSGRCHWQRPKRCLRVCSLWNPSVHASKTRRTSGRGRCLVWSFNRFAMFLFWVLDLYTLSRYIVHHICYCIERLSSTAGVCCYTSC